MGFENRPETMLAALGFGSFLLMDKSNPNPFNVLLAGVLAGLAVLTHLNGIIYVVAGFATYFYLKEYKYAILFGLAGGVVSLCYFIDILSVENGFSIWYYQFRNDPATQNAFGIWSKLRVMVLYPTMFFQTPEVLALSMVLLYVGYKQRLLIRELPPRLAVYSLALFIAFWFITKKNTGFYIILFMPFMFVLVYELYRKRPFWNVGLKVVLLAYFIIGIYGTVELIYKNLSSPYLPHEYAKLGRRVPVRSSGLVPLTFFFNEYDKYSRLLTFDSYQFQHTPKEYSPVHLATWAEIEGIAFIIVDYEAGNNPAFMPTVTMTQMGRFRRTFSDSRFGIYVLYD